MLKSVKLENFKVARKLNVPLAPLTLLSGLNGSGKSSVLHALALLRQSYPNGKASGLMLNGPLVPLGQGGDVLSENATDEAIKIELNDESGAYKWTANVHPDESLLPFQSFPEKLHPFLISPYFQYLQADRLVPTTLYPQSVPYAGGMGFLGNHGEFTVDYLACHSQDTVSDSRQVSRAATSAIPLLDQVAATNSLIDQVAGWLQEVSPGVHLKADRLKGTDNVMLSFRYLGLNKGRSREHRPTHVGFGITYSLPILVAALAAPPGSLLLLENPEAHLHPHGQAKLGELLAMCANDGVQIIVETHSDHILNGIRVAVKKGLADAEAIQPVYVTRDLALGESYIELPSILSDGQLTNWPNGFFDEWEKSIDQLLK